MKESQNCYNKGTKILTIEQDIHTYRPIEKLKPGDVVVTYVHGNLPIEFINSKRITNNPSKWTECMYLLPSINPEFEHLIVTGGHGVLKHKLSYNEIQDDKDWFSKNKKYSIIDNMYVQRAAFSNDFVKLENTEEYTYYHLSLKGPEENRRYGIWANGILSETAFKQDMIKTFETSKCSCF